MKRILIVILCLMPMLSFAAWEITPEDSRCDDCMFYLNTNVKSKGIHIVGIQKDFHNAMRLRYNPGILDIHCMILKAEYSQAGRYYVKFFDEDHYFLGERFLGTVGSNFEGELHDSYEVSTDMFHKIKYYDLIMRAS